MKARGLSIDNINKRYIGTSNMLATPIGVGNGGYGTLVS
jgi:hypothetical protein